MRYSLFGPTGLIVDVCDSRELAEGFAIQYYERTGTAPSVRESALEGSGLQVLSSDDVKQLSAQKRHPAGSPKGGEFAPKGGSGAPAAGHGPEGKWAHPDGGNLPPIANESPAYQQVATQAAKASAKAWEFNTRPNSQKTPAIFKQDAELDRVAGELHLKAKAATKTPALVQHHTEKAAYHKASQETNERKGGVKVKPTLIGANAHLRPRQDY